MSKYQFIQGEDTERGFLVGIQIYQEESLLNVDDSLSELSLLAKTAGINVVGQTHQNVRQINPATYIGSGKVEEIKDTIQYLDINVIIFDDELSPRHQRELEKRFGDKYRLIDRSTLILDIFAQNARTREGALQVELAQYEYRLPRLTRMWTHLARQAGGAGSAGGVGLRGPGETQLEVDRREISRKITKLKSDLESVRAHRSLHRNNRKKSGIPLVALVGYTNAGKSTLINSLSNSNIYAADQLFATLDPTIRRISLPNNSEALLSDTVGFIQKLPTTLIAAFRATLEEIVEADLLLHVVDISHVNAEQHIDAVEDTLAEIDATHIPRVLVLNKVDRLGAEVKMPMLVDEYDAVIPISAQQKIGLTELSTAIADVLEQKQVIMEIALPYSMGKEYSDLHNKGYVVNEVAKNTGWELTINVPKKLYNHFKTYIEMEI